MAQNTTSIVKIMAALDQVLDNVAWVDSDGRLDSLKNQLQSGKVESLDNLSRDALVGAYVALQIKRNDFEPLVETLDDESLAMRVKAMVFAEAKKSLDAASVDTDERKEKVA
ncbi:MAG: hypothetical protein LBB23_02665 [Rickettsiales bacterium]|jgi:uncharacterized protein YjgD (DUF1641 family)|nr:hypothetical protein [Rickettsiales bacterium]